MIDWLIPTNTNDIALQCILEFRSTAVTFVTIQKKQAIQSAEDERRERQVYREQIADLDWWSKYYVTKDDAAKVCLFIYLFI